MLKQADLERAMDLLAKGIAAYKQALRHRTRKRHRTDALEAMASRASFSWDQAAGRRVRKRSAITASWARVAVPSGSRVFA